MTRPAPCSTLFPYTTLFRSEAGADLYVTKPFSVDALLVQVEAVLARNGKSRGGKWEVGDLVVEDRKSTRLNSSHQIISYAVFCLKKKMTKILKARVGII